MVFDLFFPGYSRPSCEKQKVKCSVKSAANMFCVLHLGVASSELFFTLFFRVSQFGVTLAIKGDRPVTLGGGFLRTRKRKFSRNGFIRHWPGEAGSAGNMTRKRPRRNPRAKVNKEWRASLRISVDNENGGDSRVATGLSVPTSHPPAWQV